VKEEIIDETAGENTLLIQKTIRSGQCIKHPGNVVVLGDVNPGGEIIAGGHVVVVGIVRGLVHAGAAGNEKATITAFHLHPTQLRINNQITRAPDGEKSFAEEPETARIHDGQIIIESFRPVR